jgi:hypothetical protein
VGILRGPACGQLFRTNFGNALDTTETFGAPSRFPPISRARHPSHHARRPAIPFGRRPVEAVDADRACSPVQQGLLLFDPPTAAYANCAVTRCALLQHACAKHAAATWATLGRTPHSAAERRRNHAPGVRQLLARRVRRPRCRAGAPHVVCHGARCLPRGTLSAAGHVPVLV